MNNFAFFGILLLSPTAFVKTSASFNVGHGQPGCMTENELKIRVFQNYWDPTAFWACNQLYVPGQLMRCQSGTAFQKSLKKCVSWEEWVWEAPDADPETYFPIDGNPNYVEEEDRYSEEEFEHFPVDEILFDFNELPSTTKGEGKLIEEGNTLEGLKEDTINIIDLDNGSQNESFAFAIEKIDEIKLPNKLDEIKNVAASVAGKM